MKTKWDKILLKHPKLDAEIQLYQHFSNLIMNYHNTNIAPLLRQANNLREKLPTSTTRERNTLDRQIDKLVDTIKVLEQQINFAKIRSNEIEKKINDYMREHFTPRELKIALFHGWGV